VDDVDLIIELVGTLPDKPVIADIGAGSGTTALAIFAGNKDAEVHTIDSNPENIDWARRALEPYYDLTLWEGIECDSLQASLLFPEDAFHMIMLDTSHEYYYTKYEIEAWLPRLKLGGVFWFHDYIGTGVRQAVDEAVEAGLFEPIEQVGLGWAGWKV
jgi:predicted O-methyltransferase YrrM